MKNKTALVSGASSGIGWHSALKLASKNIDLILMARQKEKLNELAQLINEKHSVKVDVLPADFSDRESFHKILNENEALFSRVDILLNNAGIGEEWGPVEKMKTETIERMIDVNLNSHIQLTRKILPNMRKNNQGDIVFIGSVSGRWGCKHSSVYCATKFAIRGLVESMRMDLNGTAIRIMNVEPGLTRTHFSNPNIYEGYQPLEATDIADTIDWCLSRPPHVNIQEMVIFSTAQASANMLSRN